MNFNVKCIRGPYWLPDEQSYAEEHFGYDCTVLGKPVIVGEEPSDGFRYLHEWDHDTYLLWKDHKREVMSQLGKAIEAHELKQSLSKETAKTFEDIINEL